MGYYTQYTLAANSKGTEIDLYLTSLDDDEYDLKALEPCDEGLWSMNAKWYSSDKDMCKVSLAFPDVLFTLDGSGEEIGDIWRTWFKNGVVYAKWVADIRIPDSPELWRV